jgi:hypothetical protein
MKVLFFENAANSGGVDKWNWCARSPLHKKGTKVGQEAEKNNSSPVVEGRLSHAEIDGEGKQGVTKIAKALKRTPGNECDGSKARDLLEHEVGKPELSDRERGRFIAVPYSVLDTISASKRSASPKYPTRGTV